MLQSGFIFLKAFHTRSLQIHFATCSIKCQSQVFKNIMRHGYIIFYILIVISVFSFPVTNRPLSLWLCQWMLNRRQIHENGNNARRSRCHHIEHHHFHHTARFLFLSIQPAYICCCLPVFLFYFLTIPRLASFCEVYVEDCPLKWPCLLLIF